MKLMEPGTVVDGFTVDLTGTLSAREHAMLTVSVSRDGEPVTTLQPYLGSYGHLVALREGDLDFQVDGQVRTAEFVLTAAGTAAAQLATPSKSAGHSSH